MILYLNQFVHENMIFFKIIDKTVNLLNNPKDEIAFAIEFNNLSKVYKNTLIETKIIKQLLADLKLNTLTSLELARIYLLIKINQF